MLLGIVCCFALWHEKKSHTKFLMKFSGYYSYRLHFHGENKHDGALLFTWTNPSLHFNNCPVKRAVNYYNWPSLQTLSQGWTVVNCTYLICTLACKYVTLFTTPGNDLLLYVWFYMLSLLFNLLLLSSWTWNESRRHAFSFSHGDLCSCSAHAVNSIYSPCLNLSYFS